MKLIIEIEGYTPELLEEMGGLTYILGKYPESKRCVFVKNMPDEKQRLVVIRNQLRTGTIKIKAFKEQIR